MLVHRMVKKVKDSKVWAKINTKDGGPGSGIKGHTTAEEPTQARPAAKAEEPKGGEGRSFASKEHAQAYINGAAKAASKLLGAGAKQGFNGFEWSKKGGYADAKMKLTRMKIEKAGFKKVDFDQADHPAGNWTRNTTTFQNENGDVVKMTSRYGETSRQNSHSVAYIPKDFNKARERLYAQDADPKGKPTRDYDYKGMKITLYKNQDRWVWQLEGKSGTGYGRGEYSDKEGAKFDAEFEADKIMKGQRYKKIESKDSDPRGYKVSDQIIKGFLIYKSGKGPATYFAKNENGKEFEGTMEQIKKQIDAYWVKQDEDVMKQKVKDEVFTDPRYVVYHTKWKSLHISQLKDKTIVWGNNGQLKSINGGDYDALAKAQDWIDAFERDKRLSKTKDVSPEFQEGYEAAKLRIKNHPEESPRYKMENPYKIGTKQFRDWQDGFQTVTRNRTTQDASQAYLDGYAAARGAYGKHTNPVKDDPAKAAEWDKGWEDGKADKDELSAKGSGQEFVKHGSHFKDARPKHPRWRIKDDKLFRLRSAIKKAKTKDVELSNRAVWRKEDFDKMVAAGNFTIVSKQPWGYEVKVKSGNIYGVEIKDTYSKGSADKKTKDVRYPNAEESQKYQQLIGVKQGDPKEREALEKYYGKKIPITQVYNYRMFLFENNIFKDGKSKDKYTGDPLTKKGNKILAKMRERYGKKKGESVFYASKNKGTISGVDGKTKDVSAKEIRRQIDELKRRANDKTLSKQQREYYKEKLQTAESLFAAYNPVWKSKGQYDSKTKDVNLMFEFLIKIVKEGTGVSTSVAEKAVSKLLDAEGPISAGVDNSVIIRKAKKYLPSKDSFTYTKGSADKKTKDEEISYKGYHISKGQHETGLSGYKIDNPNGRRPLMDFYKTIGDAKEAIDKFGIYLGKDSKSKDATIEFHDFNKWKEFCISKGYRVVKTDKYNTLAHAGGKLTGGFHSLANSGWAKPSVQSAIYSYGSKDSKDEAVQMQCNECGKRFKKNITSSTVEVKCPACGGYDTDVDEPAGKVITQR